MIDSDITIVIGRSEAFVNFSKRMQYWR